MVWGHLGGAGAGWVLNQLFGNEEEKKQPIWRVAGHDGPGGFAGQIARDMISGGPASSSRPFLSGVSSSSSETQLAWAFDPWLMYLKELYHRNFDENLKVPGGEDANFKDPRKQPLAEWFGEKENVGAGLSYWNTSIKHPESLANWFDFHTNLRRREMDISQEMAVESAALGESIEQMQGQSMRARLLRAHGHLMQAGHRFEVPKANYGTLAKKNPIFGYDVFGAGARPIGSAKRDDGFSPGMSNPWLKSETPSRGREATHYLFTVRKPFYVRRDVYENGAWITPSDYRTNTSQIDYWDPSPEELAAFGVEDATAAQRASVSPDSEEASRDSARLAGELSGLQSGTATVEQASTVADAPEYPTDVGGVTRRIQQSIYPGTDPVQRLGLGMGSGAADAVYAAHQGAAAEEKQKQAGQQQGQVQQQQWSQQFYLQAQQFLHKQQMDKAYLNLAQQQMALQFQQRPQPSPWPGFKPTTIDPLTGEESTGGGPVPSPGVPEPETAPDSYHIPDASAFLGGWLPGRSRRGGRFTRGAAMHIPDPGSPKKPPALPGADDVARLPGSTVSRALTPEQQRWISGVDSPAALPPAGGTPSPRGRPGVYPGASSAGVVDDVASVAGTAVSGAARATPPGTGAAMRHGARILTPDLDLPSLSSGNYLGKRADGSIISFPKGPDGSSKEFAKKWLAYHAAVEDGSMTPSQVWSDIGAKYGPEYLPEAALKDPSIYKPTSASASAYAKDQARAVANGQATPRQAAENVARHTAREAVDNASGVKGLQQRVSKHVSGLTSKLRNAVPPGASKAVGRVLGPVGWVMDALDVTSVGIGLKTGTTIPEVKNWMKHTQEISKYSHVGPISGTLSALFGHNKAFHPVTGLRAKLDPEFARIWNATWEDHRQRVQDTYEATGKADIKFSYDYVADLGNAVLGFFKRGPSAASMPSPEPSSPSPSPSLPPGMSPGMSPEHFAYIKTYVGGYTNSDMSWGGRVAAVAGSPSRFGMEPDGRSKVPPESDPILREELYTFIQLQWENKYGLDAAQALGRLLRRGEVSVYPYYDTFFRLELETPGKEGSSDIEDFPH